jgi:MFS family permease
MSSALSRSMAVRVFLCFAFTYYLSALVRAITATLSPTLIPEFGLQSSDLGLLAGGYFLGFSLMQLPMGNWLDRHGPNKVILSFLVAAVLGCVAFACADSFTGLFLARILTGVGVSCCLMAPLTAYRRWFDAPTQMRANSWMLMTGSLGMLSSTLPVQWLLPLVGWRILFWAMAGMVLLSMVFIWWWVPKWEPSTAAPNPQGTEPPWWQAYLQVWQHPYFRRMSPLGFFSYGGLVAMQTLWAGPWLNKVSGYTALEAATGLFWINVSMLLAFWGWGMVNPWLTRHGYTANRLIAWGLPFNLLAMLGVVWGGADTGTVTWIAFFITNTVVSLAQPAVGMAFPSHLAGRALSAYNLVVFAGVFVIQWGMGLWIDALLAAGWSTTAAYQGALGFFMLCSLGGYAYFWWARGDNEQPQA